jgi:hypothetical protein
MAFKKDIPYRGPAPPGNYVENAHSRYVRFRDSRNPSSGKVLHSRYATKPYTHIYGSDTMDRGIRKSMTLRRK